MAWTTAGSRSGMGGYELHDQLSEQFFRPAGGYFANFSSSVGSTSEEIYSQQAVYFSYTWLNGALMSRCFGWTFFNERRQALSKIITSCGKHPLIVIHVHGGLTECKRILVSTAFNHLYRYGW